MSLQHFSFHLTAYFGSHVASYFVFLRFLFYLDLLLAVLLLGLVTLPQVMVMVNKINFWSTWIFCYRCYWDR